MYFLVRYLIRRPRIVTLILIFIIILSIASATGIRRLGYPRVDFQEMRITTVYPGASPEDVELNVTIKLEEALKEVVGIKEYSSRSVENLSVINVVLDPDMDDPESVKADVRRAIEGVTDLPVEVDEKPDIFDRKVDNFEIYVLVGSLPGDDTAELRKHMREIRKRLLNLDSIAAVWENGIGDREFQILLDRNKLEELSVSFDEVIQAIQLNKMRASGGSIESFTTRQNIVTFSEFETIEDVENIVIRSNFLGNNVRVRDVAAVVDGFEDNETLVRFNGKPGISLGISKKGAADVINAVEDINRVIEEYKNSSAPPEMEFTAVFDQSIDTRRRLEIVYSNALAGFALVLVVLFLFLDSRIAFWTAAGIPISIAITLIFLPVLGITINSISICGLVVVIGMVVDDAIIVAESIMRYREQGQSPGDAAVNGLRSVFKPVLGTIVTTVLAFVPMYFIPGSIGDFAVEIPSIVIIMLAASLVEATLILPAHLGHAKERSKTAEARRYVPPGQRLLNYAEGHYRRLLELALRHRMKSVAAFLAFLLVGGGAGGALARFQMFPIDQAYVVWLYGEAAQGSTLEHTSEQVSQLEEIVAGLNDHTARDSGQSEDILHAYISNVGFDFNNGQGWIQCVNCFVLQMIMTPASNRETTAAQARDYIKQEIQARNLADSIQVNFRIEGGGPPVGAPLEVRITGNDNTERVRLLQEVRSDLEGLSDRGVIDIDSNYRPGKPELRLLPEHETIARAGLYVSTIASTIRTAFDGTIVTYLQTPEEKIPFRVMLDERSTNIDRPLDGLRVRNALGNLVPLRPLVRSELAESPQNIYHFNGSRTNLVTANLREDGATPAQIYEELSATYADFSRDNPGFSIELGGEAKESADVMVQMGAAMVVALIAIYFLLIAQFDSYTQPFMVILVVPFGLVGIMIAFAIQRLDLSMLALIGILGVSGVLVNDSLVMVDFINRLRREATTPEEFLKSIVDGAALRLRPIVLTTLTTLAGLLPTAYGWIGGLDSFISPMVMAMAWGLFVGTLAVLIVIPVLYAANEALVSRFAVHSESMKARALALIGKRGGD